MLRQYAAWVIFNLAKGDRLETTSALEAKAEATDAAEKIQDPHVKTSADPTTAALLFSF